MVSHEAWCHSAIGANTCTGVPAARPAAATTPKASHTQSAPWRFSSAVHARVHLAQGLTLAPVSSRTPSSVLSIVMYVGSASSVMRSPTSVTR